MIETLLILLAIVALLGGTAAAWLYGTEQGWLRRHHQTHGIVVVRQYVKHPPNDHPGCCPACGGTGYAPDGPCWDCRGSGHPHPPPPTVTTWTLACPCGQERRRG